MVEFTGAGEVRQDGSTGRLHVSLITTKRASQANGTAGQDPQEWARQAAQYLRARQLATQAQLGPMAANARRIDPVPPKSRRRWPAVVGGIVLVAGGATAAVIVMNRRNGAPATEAGEPGQAADSADAQREMAAAD